MSRIATKNCVEQMDAADRIQATIAALDLPDPKEMPLAFEKLRHPKGWEPPKKQSITQFLKLT